MAPPDLEALRPRAFAVGYRMLGSVAEAEDIAQETLLRVSMLVTPPDEPAAWVTTVATRLAIDHLRLARVRRESYVGPWLPEPLVVDAGRGPERAGRARRRGLAGAAGGAGAALAAGARGVRAARGLRLRLLADRGGARAQRGELPPARRARARKHVEAERTRFDPDPEQGRALLERFLAAAEDGDLAALEALLTQDVVLYGDGGGKVKAATEPVSGAAAVAALHGRDHARPPGARRLRALAGGRQRPAGTGPARRARRLGRAGDRRRRRARRRRPDRPQPRQAARTSEPCHRGARRAVKRP